MKTRIQRTRYTNTNRIRSICFAFLLIFGMGFVFSSGVQAASISSVPIIIYNSNADSSVWEITAYSSDSYIFGYDTTTLPLVSGQAIPITFNNGVYDFWLDIDEGERLLLSQGDATLTFQGTPFTDGATTYYSSFIINWDVPDSYAFEFASVTTPGAGAAAPVPIPASVLLLGSGILGLIAIGRVKRRDS